MKVCVYLSYIGLGANLLHLSYVHQLSEKFGPVTIITLCKNLSYALDDDPKIKEVIVIDKKFNKIKSIFKFSTELKKYNFDKIFIYYSSPRIFIACKLAGIKDIYQYPLFKKKNLHLINAAQKFTASVLNLEKCQTYTKIYVSENKIKDVSNYFDRSKFNIVIGAGSSGPTTKWGTDNYSNLINELNKLNKFNFFVLCGPNEKLIAQEIIEKVKKKNITDLSEKNISEVIPFLASADMYVGNDSFGSHISAQSGKPSLVILLDSPKAYTDYTPNHVRIVPEGYNINNVTHGSKIDPNLIKVEQVFKKITSYT